MVFRFGVCVVVVWYVFFFKQKTAYEMRISDWSSDVCSSDLVEERAKTRRLGNPRYTSGACGADFPICALNLPSIVPPFPRHGVKQLDVRFRFPCRDRKSVV